MVGTNRLDHEYDGLSRLTSATDNNEPDSAGDNSVITFAYDSLGRAIEESQKLGALTPSAVSRAWRAGDLRSGLTYPNGRVLEYTYDALDRLSTLGDQGAPLPVAQYAYIGRGRVLQRDYPVSGTPLSYPDDAGATDSGYDGLRRPVQLRHLRSDGSLVVGFTHDYDRMNNPLFEDNLHDETNSQFYGYDSAYRLTGLPASNALTPRPRPPSTASGPWTEWATGSKWTGRPAAIPLSTRSSRSTGTGNPQVLSDDSGNEVDSGSYLFQWDYRNRLRTVTRKSDSTLIAVYTYDAWNRRIRKVVTNSDLLNGTTDFYLAGWRVVEERNGADELVRQYVYGRYIDEPLTLDRNLDGDDSAIGAGDQRLFYHQSRLYSVFALTDSTGTVVEG